MKKYLFFPLLLAFSWGEVSVKDLKNGDLIFVGAENSAFSEAISNATKKDSANFTHTAIVEVSKDGIFVIEASSDKNGVVRTAWQDFQKENKKRHIELMRLKDSSNVDMNATITRAKSFLGQAYDFYFYPNNSKMYCTELVWEAYLDNKGKRIFEAKPMNFYAADGSLPVYFKELFEKLGVAVPQGVLGTNPNDMSKSKALYRVK